MIVSVKHRAPGDAACFRPLLDQIIAEFPEFTWQRSHSEAFKEICEETESIDRVEITVTDPDGALVGFAVVVDEEDPHVGPCLGVQWRYVSPSSRGPVGVALQRGIIKLARMVHYSVVAYTKRLGEGRYEINYLKLKEDPNGQEN